MSQSLTPEQIAARRADTLARLQSNQKSPRFEIQLKVYTPLEFLRKFTQAERIAIKAAAAGSPELADFMYLLEMAQEIRTTDPDLINGIKSLVAAGLLTEERSLDILS